MFHHFSLDFAQNFHREIPTKIEAVGHSEDRRRLLQISKQVDHGGSGIFHGFFWGIKNEGKNGGSDWWFQTWLVVHDYKSTLIWII